VTDLEFTLRGDCIALDALLKAAGAVSSGGAAKQLIVAGEVSIDGNTDRARSRKVRAGQVVRTGPWKIRVVAPAAVEPDRKND
jgi:ribosome-associated protein